MNKINFYATKDQLLHLLVLYQLPISRNKGESMIKNKSIDCTNILSESTPRFPSFISFATRPTRIKILGSLEKPDWEATPEYTPLDLEIEPLQILQVPECRC